MRLTRQHIKNRESWSASYRLPSFDIDAVKTRTRDNPTWLHIGAGNIFRAFTAVLQQDLLESGLTDSGIIVCECYDEGIIPACFAPHDNLTLAVRLHASGQVDKRVIASVAEAFTNNGASDNRLCEIMSQPSLQMVSFTITEKGYSLPVPSGGTIEQVTVGLLARFKANRQPLALVSLDNCSENGSVLAKAIKSVAEAWLAQEKVPADFVDYVSKLSYPWTMIDKITPHPSKAVADLLKADGYEDYIVTETAKRTVVASFVNAEVCQYLVIEDDFPNGRPPLDKAGVIFTDRATVQKIERMKVCACLNPLHTILAVSGMLLGYPTIAACMQDKRLVNLIKRAAYDECLPIVDDPVVLNPGQFLNDVLTERLPNSFIPDTPGRIATDTSQKIPVRFGVNLQTRRKKNMPMDDLKAIPFFFALWLRYLMGTNDQGKAMTLSPDPRLDELTAYVSAGSWQPVLSDATLFGVDLYEVSLAEKVERIFEKLSAAPGAVSRALDDWK